MNYWKSNSNLIGVESLLESCPTLPKEEEVRTAARQLKKRIIDPFKRDMDYLKTIGALTEWRYCPTDDAAITKAEEKNPDFAKWKTWNIAFELADYPKRERKEPEKVTKKTDAKLPQKTKTPSGSKKETTSK